MLSDPSFKKWRYSSTTKILKNNLNGTEYSLRQYEHEDSLYGTSGFKIHHGPDLWIHDHDVDFNAEERELQAEREADQREQRAKLDKEEIQRQNFRDADVQDVPYTYQIDTHGNESLAIRYGIANMTVSNRQSEIIRLQKRRKLKEDKYEVLLSDFRDRPAIVIIEPGTEFVKTFYQLDEIWFKEHKELELTLKGNGSFTLKELATFHVLKAVG